MLGKFLGAWVGNSSGLEDVLGKGPVRTGRVRRVDLIGVSGIVFGMLKWLLRVELS